ncbi:dnaJ homolog subfamily C member 17 isoform X1 [Palaemon carinicauda]|uniref:dnaJ homolog subfamily C member 17 isoform X1 n=1 Tax=Palaemon carinicauda TaxID=392227 RepID=UPI0035B59AAA
MSFKSQELTKLDFYEILDLKIDAGEKEIKKSYRKKALKCHPDKNPDNPDAAKEFDRLKKILEILLDPGARKAYNKVLKARKASKLRAQECDAKTQKLKSDLEERERRAQSQSHISEEERFRRELKRLEDEGQRIIEEELDKLNREVERDLKGTSGVNENKCTTKETDVGHKVKVKWTISRETPGYSEEDIRQLFYKWGDINAMVMKQKSKKGTALIEYKTKTGAIVTDGFQLDFWVTVFGPRMNKSNFKDMAVQFEKGQIGKPLEVVHVKAEAPKVPEHKEIPEEEKDQSGNYDYESIADMNIRRQDERRRLIEEILKEEAMK